MYSETRVTKIILDLTHSMNNYEWEDVEELEDRIRDVLSMLWEFYSKTEDVNIRYFGVEERNALYDLLDMFERRDFITKESEGDDK